MRGKAARIRGLTERIRGRTDKAARIIGESETEASRDEAARCGVRPPDAPKNRIKVSHRVTTSVIGNMVAGRGRDLVTLDEET